jgi:sugar-phosphatase
VGLLAELDVRAVIFDMDGTLLDSVDSIERGWDRLAEAMGIDRDTAPFTHGVPSIQTIRAILPEATDDVVSKWNAFHLGVEADDAGASTPIDGVFELLEALRTASVPWAIATGCQRRLGEARHAAAGLPRPGVFVCAEDYGRGKPAPDAFLKAAEMLGVDPARTIVVEDAPVGVEAGVASGAFVCAVTFTHPREELGAAHVIVDSLDELRDLLLSP